MKSSTQLVHDLGVEFHALGHEVMLLAPSETLRNRVEVSSEDGIRVVRVRSGKIKGAGLLARAWQEVGLSHTLWKGARDLLKANPCDLIVYYSPTIFFGALVARLKKLWDCPAYLILRDIFPQWAVDAGVLRRGFVYQYFRRKELQQYAAADVIGVQTPANLKYFHEQLRHKRYRLEVLYNWTLLQARGVVAGRYRKDLGLEGKIVFFFGGNIGVAQDMDNIMRLAVALRDYENAFFLMVGEGSEVPRLKAMISKLKLQNIRILPTERQDAYLSMLSEFDVGLISLDKRLSTHNVPGKLMGYMQFSKPVLASINEGNDLKEILEEAQAGFCLINGDDDGLRKAALKLLQDEAERKRMGANSRRLLERTFAVSAAADKILRCLNTS